MFSLMTWPFRGTNWRLRIAMLPVFVFAVMACTSVPASAQLSIRLTVHNPWARGHTFEVARTKFNRGGEVSVVGDKESFWVPAFESRVAPIQDWSLWVALKCPSGPRYGLEFRNPLTGYPSVTVVEPDMRVDPKSKRHEFGTQVHLRFYNRLSVYRHDDSGNRKVFSETIDGPSFSCD
jgi:hypothetical protein